MDLIKYKYFFIGSSLALTVLAAASILGFGFRQGIDFAGGTLWQIRFQSDAATPDSLNQFLESAGIRDLLVRPGATSHDFSLRTAELSEAEHQNLAESLQAKFGPMEELSFASIGPAIGVELRNRAIKAFLLVLLGISLYIAFAFRKVFYPVSSWRYGFITLITLFHDALIPAGFFAWLGWQYGIEADTNFIVAILVIMGFSVHDTIVVFDRIRENLLLAKNKEDLKGIINASVNQTFARSINTSLTLVLVLIMLYLFGAQSLSHFTLLILVGTIIGTYSSIFVASPLLTLFTIDRK